MARERYQYAARQRAYRNPERIAEDAIYERLNEYEGETLTIESITVGIWDNKVSAFLRYDADTAFSIGIGEKAEWALFTAAGYTLPCRATHDKGTYPFHAEVVCEWRKALHGREWGLHVKFVESKEETMQPETELTPLAKQSAIETICHLDSRVTSVQASFDVMLSPVVRIECHTKHKAAIESAIAAYHDGSVTVTWKMVGKPAFTGKFEKTEKIPTAAIMAAGDDSEGAAAGNGAFWIPDDMSAA